MNYKIKITAENQAIVKRIADDNGMNPNRFTLMFIRHYHTIENGIFERYITNCDFQELTTEQFIEMFDKRKETTELGLLKIELNHTKTLLTSCEYALQSRDNFKSRVIELFEKRINICKELMNDNKESNQFRVALTWQDCMLENIEMLKQINEIIE